MDKIVGILLVNIQLLLIRRVLGVVVVQPLLSLPFHSLPSSSSAAAAAELSSHAATLPRPVRKNYPPSLRYFFLPSRRSLDFVDPLVMGY